MSSGDASSMTSFKDSPPGISLQVGDCQTIPTEVCLFLISKYHSNIREQVFIAAAAYLLATELNCASQVCKSWRAALHATPKFWRHLVLDIDRPWVLDKARTWCSRSGRALYQLSISQCTIEHWAAPEMTMRMKTLRNIILEQDGGANLQIIEYYAYTSDIYSLYALNLFCSFLMPS